MYSDQGSSRENDAEEIPPQQEYTKPSIGLSSRQESEVMSTLATGLSSRKQGTPPSSGLMRDLAENVALMTLMAERDSDGTGKAGVIAGDTAVEEGEELHLMVSGDLLSLMLMSLRVLVNNTLVCC